MPKIRSVTILGLNSNGKRISTAEFKYNKGSELEFDGEEDCREKAKTVLRQFLKLPEPKLLKKHNKDMTSLMVVKTNEKNGIYYF